MSGLQKSACWGVAVFSLAAARSGLQPLAFTWPALLVLAGAGVFVPLGLHLLLHHPAWRQAGMKLPAGVPFGIAAGSAALAVSMQIPALRLLALLWPAVTVAIAAAAIHSWRSAAEFPGLRIALSGLLQLSIGGAWAAADVLGISPLGFSGTVVRLTAAHFHFAGFCLPLVAGLAVAAAPGRVMLGTAMTCAAGILPVAAGITITHFTGDLRAETVLASLLSLGLIGFALLQGRLALQLRSLLLGISSLSLLSGAVLALLYALRLVVFLPRLHLPFMWAVHGSLQVFGFCGCGFAAWFRIQRRDFFH